MSSEILNKIVSSLVLLRKKKQLESSKLLQTLFPILTNSRSKSLRALLFQKVLQDLRGSNSNTKNHKLNKSVQSVLLSLLLEDRTSSQGIWAVKLTRELWKRRVWDDAKAVDIMKEAALSDNQKVIIAGVRFFLGVDQAADDDEESSSDEEEGLDVGKLRYAAGITKKTKKKAKSLDKAVATVKRKEKKKNAQTLLNFSALHLLYDPQSFAETLFARHLAKSKSKLNLEQKLQVLQLVTRLVGLHKLIIFQLYSYFLKYLTPRQPSVTIFLASLAQGTHNLVPPDALEPLIMKIANEFVSEASASVVASAGLNAIREICARQPLAMNETLLQDLVQYKRSKDKSVMMAAKGLLGLYREVGATMLRKKDRGKSAALSIQGGLHKDVRYGDTELPEFGIEGIELLEEYKERQRQEKEGLLQADGDVDEVASSSGSSAWEEDSDEDSDSGSWHDVSSDGAGEEVPIQPESDHRGESSRKRRKLSPGAEKVVSLSASEKELGGLPEQQGVGDASNSERQVPGNGLGGEYEYDDLEEGDNENEDEQDEDLETEASRSDAGSDIEGDEEFDEADVDADSTDQQADGISAPPTALSTKAVLVREAQTALNTGQNITAALSALKDTLPSLSTASRQPSLAPSITPSSAPTLNAISNLATTRILTPRDLALLQSLRLQASVTAAMPSHRKHHAALTSTPTKPHDPEAPIRAEDLVSGPRTARQTREERIAHAKEGRDDRDTFKGKAGRFMERKAEKGSSKTNREKERKKAFLMTINKRKKSGRVGLHGKGVGLRSAQKIDRKAQRGKGGKVKKVKVR